MPSEKTMSLKTAQVDELAAKLKDAKSAVFADYRGLTVEQDTKLRKDLREAGIEYAVVKNSIIRFAAGEIGMEGLDSMLQGPTAIAISMNDPVAPSKLLFKFAKDLEKFELKGGVVEGKVVDVDGVGAIASLPSKEELIAKMLGGLKNPLYGIVNVLNGNIRGLVVALNAIAEKKQAE